MKILYFDEIKTKIPNLAVTIGQFDGLHIAHMKLLNECLNSKNHKAVITFDPLILNVLGIDNTYPILEIDDKIKKCKELGFDYFIIIKTTKEFLNLNKDEFIKVLNEKLEIKKLIVGFDFTFGKMGSGKANDLNIFNTIIIPKIVIDNKKIGTKLIKEYLKDGNIKDANKYLGYNFYLKMNNNSFNSSLNLLANKEYKVLIDGKEAIINPFIESKIANNSIIEFIE